MTYLYLLAQDKPLKETAVTTQEFKYKVWGSTLEDAAQVTDEELLRIFKAFLSEASIGL